MPLTRSAASIAGPPSGAAGGDLAGTYPNPDIGTGVIVNTDVNASAAIAYSKLASLATNHILAGNAGVPTDTTLSGDATIGATGVVTIANSAVTDAKVAAANKDGTAGTASMRTLGTGAQTAAAGNDTRFPAGADIVNADISGSAAIAESKLNLASDAAAGTASRRTLGTASTAAAAGNDSRFPVTVRKTANESVNDSTVLQDDNDLILPVAANELWFIEAFLLVTASSATADWKFGWSGPAGATASWGPLGDTSTLGGGFVSVTTATSPVTGFAAIGGSRALGGAAITYPIVLMGWFVVSSTPGGITLRWAQNTQTAEDNTILAQSFLRGTLLN